MNYIRYEQYMIKSNRKYHNYKTKTFLKVFLLIMLVSIFLIVAVVNKTRIENIFGLNRQAIYSSTKVYLLKFSDFDKIENAYLSAREIKSIGGAGFVKNNNGRYSVYVSTYPTKERAEKVKSNLLSKGINTTIEELIFEDFILKNSESGSQYKDCLQGYILVYNKLYDVFEKNESNSLIVSAKQEVINIYQDFDKKLKDFNEFSKTSKELSVCDFYLNKLLDILKNIISFDTDIYWTLQYSLIKIAFGYQSMIMAINCK